MYPLGILFGLGFDTSSEIALLGISSVEAAKGTNFWVILIFPALFTGKPATTEPEVIFHMLNPCSWNVSPRYHRRSLDALSLRAAIGQLPPTKE